MPTPSDPWSIILTSVAISTLLAAFFQFINGSLDRAAADRRHLREQALKLAVEQWQHEAKLESQGHMAFIGDKIIREHHGPPARDLHEVVFRALQFADAFSKQEVTESNLRTFLSKPKPDAPGNA